MYCEKKAVDREEQHKKAHNCCDLWVPPLFLSGVLWEEVVDDGYSAIVGAHKHIAASSS
jgi:hypothetical protein